MDEDFDYQTVADPVVPVHDNQTEARLFGYSWGDIFGHIEDGITTALGFGYRQNEIDDHLGYGDQKSTVDGLAARAAVDSSHEDGDPSGGAVDLNALGTDRPSVGLNQDQRQEYANALREGRVKTPEQFGSAFSGALNLDGTPAYDQVAKDTAAQLPSFDRLTDYAARIAHDADLNVDASVVRTIRNNMLDRWAKTGETPEEMHEAAFFDPDQARSLILSPTATMPPVPGQYDIEKLGRDAIKYHDPLSEIQHIDITGTVGLAAGFAQLPEALKDHEAKIAQMRANGADPEDIEEAQRKNPAYDLIFGSLAYALPFAGGVIKHVAPEVAGAFPKMLADESGSLNLWHGTPHMFVEEPEAGAPFGRFKMEAIGSGEGTANEGHGLYFASNRAVGQVYQRLLGDERMLVGGEPYDTANPVHEAALARYFKNTPEEAIADIQDRLEGHRLISEALGAKPEDAAHIARYEKALELLQSGTETPEVRPNKGHLYEVHVDAEPEQFIEWNKPLTEQSPGVEAKLRGLLDKGDEETGVAHNWDEHTGEDIYRHLARQKDADGKALGDRGASELLAKEGIPGHRYSNQGDKVFAEGPNTNHVIYDPDIIRITGRDGQPLPTPAQAFGHVVADGLRQRMTQLFRDVLHDESGSLNLFRTQQQIADRARNAAATEAVRADLREGRGERNQLMAMAKNGLEQFRKVVNKGADEHAEWVAKQAPGHSNFNPLTGAWDISQHQMLIDHMEGRNSPVKLAPNSPLFPVAQVMRDFQQRLSQIMNNTPGMGLAAYKEWRNGVYKYQWQEPAKMGAAFSGRGTTGTFPGNQPVPHQYDALANGHKPIHLDPLENQLNDMMGKLDWRRLFMARNNLVARGDGVWATSKPEGMEPLNGVGTRRGNQQLYALPGAARSYNNEVSNGIYRMMHPTGAAIWDTIQRYNNATIGYLLGGPIYHAWTISGEALMSGISRAYDRAAHGEFLKALQSTALAGTIVPHIAYNLYTGIRVGQEWSRPGRHPALTPIVEALKSADYRFSGRGDLQLSGPGGKELPGWWQMIRDGDVRRQMHANFDRVFGDAAKENMPKRVAMFAPRTADSLITEVMRLQKMLVWPVMEKLVPWTRNGSAALSMQDWLRRNPIAAHEQMRAQAQRISDSTDNRFGEMNLDNLFMNRVVRQIAQVTPVSLGWALGTYRAVGGGVKELLNGLRGVANRNLPQAVDNLLGEQARWLVAFPIGQAMINSMLTYLYTGEAPWDSQTPFKDAAFFRTNGRNKDNTPERGISWGYAKDWTKWAIAAFSDGSWLDRTRELAKTVAGSFINNPLSNTAHDLYTGKDWADRNIRSIVQGLNHGKEPEGLQQLWYILKSNLNPIALAQQAAAKAGTGLGAVSRFIGLRPAPAAVQNPEGYAAMKEQMHKRDVVQVSRSLLKQEQNLLSPDPERIAAFQEAIASLSGGGGGGGRSSGGGAPRSRGAPGDYNATPFSDYARDVAVGGSGTGGGRASGGGSGGYDRPLSSYAPRVLSGRGEYSERRALSGAPRATGVRGGSRFASVGRTRRARRR